LEDWAYPWGPSIFLSPNNKLQKIKGRIGNGPAFFAALYIVVQAFGQELMSSAIFLENSRA
jgi:hypothetical protein